MVVIDVSAGDCEVGDDLTATMRLIERNPGAMTWEERFGYPASYRASQRRYSRPGIKGRVSANQSSDGATAPDVLVEIGVAGRSRVFQTIEVVVDTGSTGWLTLPVEVIGQIGLVSPGQRPTIPASVEALLFSIYAVLVDWLRPGPFGDQP